MIKQIVFGHDEAHVHRRNESGSIMQKTITSSQRMCSNSFSCKLVLPLLISIYALSWICLVLFISAYLQAALFLFFVSFVKCIRFKLNHITRQLFFLQKQA